MSEYKDLQAEAKELEIKYVGVSLGELKRMVEQAKSETPNEVPVETPTEKKKEIPNIAVVKNATKQEIRRYTEEQHGKDFAELAKQFASKHDNYKVVLIEGKPSIVCENCGHVLK